MKIVIKDCKPIYETLPGFEEAYNWSNLIRRNHLKTQENT